MQKKRLTTGVIAIWMLIAIQSDVASAASEKEDDYRFPLASPVTCKGKERGKVFKAAQLFYTGTDPSHVSFDPGHIKKLNRFLSAWKAWELGCYRVCPKLKPIKPEPAGYGWQYSGQYGKLPYRNCWDRWLSLTRKDGDRVTFEYHSTNRTYAFNREFDPEIHARNHIIKCSTREQWDDEMGWVPI